jgi:hypothetical protein
MSNTVRRVWIASIFLAGTLVVCRPAVSQASEATARDFRIQDAGTGTAPASAPAAPAQAQQAGTGTAPATAAAPPARPNNRMRAAKSEKTSDTKTTHKKTRTLTGCLLKGEDASEYTFTAKDGGDWEIKSDSVELDQHVGHTVKIVGVVSNATAHGMKEDMKEEMKEHGMNKHATEHGHLTVTDLTVVSDTCQK